MVDDGRNKPPDFPPGEEPMRKAWSDAKDHIIVRHGNDEHGYDTVSAIKLLRQLEVAIRDSV